MSDHSMKGEALEGLRESYKQLPHEALMATIEDVCRERDEAERRLQELRDALEWIASLKHPGNAWVASYALAALDHLDQRGAE